MRVALFALMATLDEVLGRALREGRSPQVAEEIAAARIHRRPAVGAALPV
jgi:hypothetical protein